MIIIAVTATSGQEPACIAASSRRIVKARQASSKPHGTQPATDRLKAPVRPRLLMKRATKNGPAVWSSAARCMLSCGLQCFVGYNVGRGSSELSAVKCGGARTVCMTPLPALPPPPTCTLPEVICHALQRQRHTPRLRLVHVQHGCPHVRPRHGHHEATKQ